MNENGYLERKTKAGRRNAHGKCTTRNWWMIKSGTTSGAVNFGSAKCIVFPLEYLGRKVRFKVEFIGEKK